MSYEKESKTAAELQEVSKPRQRNSDKGSERLPHMEQYIKLVRKIRIGAMVSQLVESVSGQKLQELHAVIAVAGAGLSLKQRDRIFQETATLSSQTQAHLEAAAERINLLCDEYGAQIVSEFLDPDEPVDAALLQQQTSKYCRALYLYLRQEHSTDGAARDLRFEQAELRNELVQQAGQQKFSSHFLGPKGVVPVLDDDRKSRVVKHLLTLYPGMKESDIVVEAFHSAVLVNGEKQTDSVVWSITFNGKQVHYQYVANGEVEEVETVAASCIRFDWSVSRGTLGVYCEEIDHRSELAMMFRDIGMGGGSDIQQMPIWEFDLTGFSTPAILPRLKINRIEGIEAIEIRSLTVFKPEIKSVFSQGREINRRIENALILKRHRFESRDIFEVADHIHRISDLSGYIVAQVKLGIRVSKTPNRSAHSVSVQVSMPNGFSDESKTKVDSALILRQLQAIGCARHF